MIIQISMKSQKKDSSPSALRLAFSGWGLSLNGLINNQQGEWWLLAQLILISAHLLPAWPSPTAIGFSWPVPLTIAGALLFFIGIALVSKAFLRLGPNLSPLPEPKPGAALVTSGAYRNCRHPLYQGLITSSIGVMLFQGSILHLLLLIGLCGLLKGKAQYEEQRLIEIHREYRSYLKNTPAIFPNFPVLDWRN